MRHFYPGARVRRASSFQKGAILGITWYCAALVAWDNGVVEMMPQGTCERIYDQEEAR